MTHDYEAMEKPELIALLQETDRKVAEMADTQGVTDLFPRIEALETQLEEEEARRTTLQGQYDALQKEAEAKAARLAALEAEQAQRENSSADETKQQLEEAERKVAEAQEETADAKQKAAAVQNKLRDELQTTVRKLQEAESQAKALRSALNQAEQATAKTTRAMEDAAVVHEHERKQALQQQARAHENDTIELKAQLSELRSQVEMAKRKAAAAVRKGDVADEMELKINTLTETIAAQGQLIGQLRGEVKQLTNENRRVARDAHDAGPGQRKKDTQVIADLKRELHSVRTQLADAVVRHDKCGEREQLHNRERASLNAEIQRMEKLLKRSQASSHPTSMKVMELEVRNQLLMGMIQKDPKLKLKPKASYRPTLPPILRRGGKGMEGTETSMSTLAKLGETLTTDDGANPVTSP